MAFQNFLIAPLKSGIQTNRKPWLIADDAYELLRNVYCWRGRVKKRFGARVMDQTQASALQQQFTRLRVNIGMTDDVGNFDLGAVPGAIHNIGQMFSIGPDYFTVNALGNPANLLVTNAATTGTYDTTTGAVVFTGTTPLADVFFYPATPVMHIAFYQQSDINAEVTIAFDQEFSYKYTQGIGWQRSGVVPGLWTGTDHDFHSTANYRGVEADSYNMYTVNNVAADGIQYFDGIDWNTLPPPVTNAAGDTILTALITIEFKNTLMLIGTIENIVGVGIVTYPSRIRWCTPYGDPTAADAWRDDIEGKGDFLDASTNETIVAAESLKDRLILFFESSTYEFVWTGNFVQSFVYQKINTELGVESTHSTIPFDKVVLGMGGVGIHSCNGLNVERIDDDIPTAVFDISNSNFGPERVQGIRDYYEELAYFSFPSDTENYRDSNTFPNRMLILDYVNGTWSYNDDSITALGYYHIQNDYLIWQNIQNQWQEMDFPWNFGAGYNLFRSVLAGNQEGFMFILTPDLVRNSMSLQITDITLIPNGVVLTVINHNVVPTSPYIYLNNIQSRGIVNTMGLLNNTIQQAQYIDLNTIQININGIFGVYTGGGTIERVSQIEILTKQYNFFPQSAKRIYIPYVDFYVDKTTAGQITVDYFSSTSTLPVLPDAAVTGTLLGTGVLETSPYALYPYEATQVQFWHKQYMQIDGENIQLHLYMTNNQMLNITTVENGFVLNAMQFFAQETGPLI